MSTCILLAGVGGQGTILMSKILATGLAERGFDVKMSEIHGMSQRDGSVTTEIKYGGCVHAPNIGYGEADMIVSFEKIEAVRALPYLKEGGAIITDDREIFPISVLTGKAEYPHDVFSELTKRGVRVTVIKAGEEAERLGNIRAQNIVLLGALVKSMGLEDVDWKALIARLVPAKAAELNLRAFDVGYAMQ